MENEKVCHLTFLYGENYENHIEKNKYPTEGQLKYIISLMTRLEKATTSYGITFPYKKDNTSLLEPREKFVYITKNTEVGVIIDCLNELLVNIVNYETIPTTRVYEEINTNLNVLNRYFMINKIKKVKDSFKNKIPQEEWEQAKEKEELMKLKKKELRERKKEAKEKAEWLKQYHPEMIGAPVIEIIKELKKDLNEICCTNMISENQAGALVNLIEDALAFVRLMSKRTEHFNTPYAINVIHFMTFGEAGAMINIMKEFCEACWSITEKTETGFEFNYKNLLSEEFIAMLDKMGDILPYIKQSVSELNPTTEQNSILSRQHLSKMEGRLEKIKNYSSTNAVEQLNISFNSIFEKRQFLAELYHYLYEDYQEFDYSYSEYVTVYDIVEPFFRRDDNLDKGLKAIIFDDNDKMKDLLFYAEDVLERIS